jgi:hypothetical protein
MSPYENVDEKDWLEVTNNLIEKHPLKSIIVDLCLKSWQSILNGKINTYLNLKIKEMHISPQATGALLHDIIPEYITKNTDGFRKGDGKEKDVVCESDDSFSFEIKTSSQKSIFGNRSYAKSEKGKTKEGYYLTVNFEKIASNEPRILKIQFGWLDHSDWMGQKSETGQQASLTKQAKSNKLITLFEVK